MCILCYFVHCLRQTCQSYYILCIALAIYLYHMAYHVLPQSYMRILCNVVYGLHHKCASYHILYIASATHVHLRACYVPNWWHMCILWHVLYWLGHRCASYDMLSIALAICTSNNEKMQILPSLKNYILRFSSFRIEFTKKEVYRISYIYVAKVIPNML